MTKKPSHQAASRHLRRQGAALVIILAFVVLLTVLVVAYFSYAALQRQISQAGLNQTTADVFAQGAINTVISDLKQEIVAGSTNLSTNTAVYQVYYPLSPTNAVPALAGSTGTNGLENLVKRSASGQAFYPGGTSRAAPLSTTNASQNGRFLSADRWNAALLLPKANTNSATDLTPTNTFTPPDWILVARDGSNPTAWNNNMRWNATNGTSVVGRYAYAIYDEGGLLDVNVAGHPPGSSTNFTADKGGLAYADLTVLPGMSTSAVSALVGWRNAASAGPGGAFPTYTFDDTSRTNYFNFVRGNASGFLRTANTNITAGQTDRQFVSRQQLIQFLTKGIAASDAEKAALQNSLQYLGTFSRDLEQPSFRPDPNRPKNIKFEVDLDGGNDQGGGAFDSTGTKQDKVNPLLLVARDSAGQPVMKRRFPLSRLALIKPDPPAADAAKIYDYFGLTWDPGNMRWTYDHGGGAGKIYTLSDIPDGREPDFFEILRATIHCDSLGKQLSGLDNPSNPISPHMMHGAAIDSFVNYQIAQIGANLIDQYDADSYPTTIFYNDREFHGIENLPYLAGWELLWYRLRALTPGADINTSTWPPPSTGTTWETAVMLQPIIWNPHIPDPAANPVGVPQDFRILASGMGDIAPPSPFGPIVTTDWWTNKYTERTTYPASDAYASANLMTKAGSLFIFPEPIIDPSISILTFSTGSGDAGFHEPYRLRAPNYPTGSNASTDSGYAAGKITHSDSTLLAAGEPATVIGFFCGKAWTGPSQIDSSAGTWLSKGTLRRDLKFKLQYKNPSGQWLTYDVMEQVYTTAGVASVVDNPDTAPNLRGFQTCLRADPRTNRWGVFRMNTLPSQNSGDIPSGLNSLPNNGVNNTCPLYFLPQGTTWKPTESSTYYLRGNNQGGADAAGWTSANYNVGDLMVNLTGPSGNPNCGTKTSSVPGAKTYYSDPDGVVRRSSGGNFSGNDGLPLYSGNSNSRPVILNRPFRSVAEMGYAFRGQAWRDIDFFTPESGDAALLDAFCLNELDQTLSENPVVAGRLSLNTRQPKTVQALIEGVSKAEGGIISAAEARKAAEALVNWTTDATTVTSGVLTKGPLRNRSELVGKFVSQISVAPKPSLTGGQDPILDPTKTYSGFSSMLTSTGTNAVFSASGDAAIKRRRECIMRALADSGNTRTWNLLIDLAAQVGRYPTHATKLDQFVVEGETRYWLHLAIDRITGKVIAEQFESVSE